MGYWITKKTVGRGALAGKEVRIRINKSGESTEGEQRYSVAMRFTEDGQKKATESGYVAMYVDDDLNRLYFRTAQRDEGYKLRGSSEKSKVKSFSFTPNHLDDWKPLVGEYDMKKDVVKSMYYIDLPTCPEE